MNIIEKVKRKLGWLPVLEREYHYSFRGCVHHWNWEKFGQCPQCARSALRAINWNYVKKDDMASLKGIIKAARR